MFFITEDTKHAGTGLALHHLHYLHDGFALHLSTSSLTICFCFSMSRSYINKANILPNSANLLRTSWGSHLLLDFRTMAIDNNILKRSLVYSILLVLSLRIRQIFLAGVRHLRPINVSCIVLDNALTISSMRVQAFNTDREDTNFQGYGGNVQKRKGDAPWGVIFSEINKINYGLLTKKSRLKRGFWQKKMIVSPKKQLPLTSSKILPLENEKKSKLSFCILLV